MARETLKRRREAVATRGDGPLLEIHDQVPIGELLRRFSTDSSHLIQQEINLARTELRVTADRLGRSATSLGIALGVALPGALAFTAFLIIGLGVLIESYWLSALIVSVVLLAIAGFLAKRALDNMRAGQIGFPETAGTLREDSIWARDEARNFKQEITA